MTVSCKTHHLASIDFPRLCYSRKAQSDIDAQFKPSPRIITTISIYHRQLKYDW